MFSSALKFGLLVLSMRRLTSSKPTSTSGLRLSTWLGSTTRPRMLNRPDSMRDGCSWRSSTFASWHSRDCLNIRLVTKSVYWLRWIRSFVSWVSASAALAGRFVVTMLGNDDSLMKASWCCRASSWNSWKNIGRLFSSRWSWKR